MTLAGAAAVGGATQGYRYVKAIEADLPELTELEIFSRDGTMTIKAGDGTILQQMGPATREKVSYADLPRPLVNAFVSSEDRRFYEHTGVDFPAIARAAYANFQEREVVEGASTITQQLARIVFLDQDQTLERKLREALLARKIERQLLKSEVLEKYLNLVYLGSGAYGVADAAWVYFSKSVDELTLPEMAMIAGMAPAPSEYSPLVNPDAARQRRDLVLRRMQVDGYISTAEADAAIATELTVNPSTPKYLYSEVPYFTSYVQQQLGEILTPEQMEIGGFTVETTLNPQWQRYAETTVQEAIERWGPGQRFEQASLAAVDPRTGEIKALVGGNDFLESQFNRAVQAQRQPGSTFKAFVYTTAIAAGFSPYKGYDDAKYVVDGYEPKNYGGGYSGSVSMRQALASSINIVAVKVLVDVGFDPVISMAQAMGIESELLPTYSLALGASEVNLLELTSAYGSLAAEGMHHPVHAIVRVINRDGTVLYDASSALEARRAVDAETASIMTWMLRDVVQGGTGSRAAIDRPVAGKTGTSERNRDLWFIGYIPQLVVGVWLGNDDSSPTYGASSTAAATWREFMLNIINDIPVEEFPDLPALGGREGSIKAEPVRPGRVTAQSASESRDDESDETGGSEAAPSSSTASDSSEPAESAAPARNRGDSGRSSDRPAPVVEDKEPEPEVIDNKLPPSTPAPAPPAESAPPAPPAPVESAPAPAESVEFGEPIAPAPVQPVTPAGSDPVPLPSAPPPPAAPPAPAE